MFDFTSFFLIPFAITSSHKFTSCTMLCRIKRKKEKLFLCRRHSVYASYTAHSPYRPSLMYSSSSHLITPTPYNQEYLLPLDLPLEPRKENNHHSIPLDKQHSSPSLSFSAHICTYIHTSLKASLHAHSPSETEMDVILSATSWTLTAQPSYNQHS